MATIKKQDLAQIAAGVGFFRAMTVFLLVFGGAGLLFQIGAVFVPKGHALRVLSTGAENWIIPAAIGAMVCSYMRSALVAIQAIVKDMQDIV